MMILIPIISALMYRAGGTEQWKWCILNQKTWRYLIGVPIALTGVVGGHGWISILAIPAYYLALNIPYGEKSWLNFCGEWCKFLVCGFALGACSFVLLPWWLALSQLIVSGILFLVVKYLDDHNIIKNPWVELARGFGGTILYVFL